MMQTDTVRQKAVKSIKTLILRWSKKMWRCKKGGVTMATVLEITLLFLTRFLGIMIQTSSLVKSLISVFHLEHLGGMEKHHSYVRTDIGARYFTLFVMLYLRK